MKKICLVSPGHVASNPRLVKEANSLVAAGYDVRVVAGDTAPFVRPLDESLLASVKWTTCDRIGLGTHPVYIWRKLKHKLARIAFQFGLRNIYIAMWAHSPMSDLLSQAASVPSADLYIAHCLAALPAAAIAAERNNAKLSFDVEDFHVGELAEIPENKLEIAIRNYIERTLLPRCCYLTASSPMIASVYRNCYGVSIEPILNVFPLSEAPVKTKEVNSKKRFSLYWFSQTIGADRGIESIISAIGQMQTPVDLYLRGMPTVGYIDVLIQLAHKEGVIDCLYLLPPVPPADMVQLASDYDIGLSIEPGRDTNNSICLGNKIFTCLLAGLPIILSKTPAQEALSHKLLEASIVIDINDPNAIARTLDTFFSNPTNLELSRAVAWKLGREVYNWDIEQNKFLDVVENALK